MGKLLTIYLKLFCAIFRESIYNFFKLYFFRRRVQVLLVEQEYPSRRSKRSKRSRRAR